MKGNLLTQTTELARHLTQAYLSPGDLAIDATCGRGNDTLWLAEAVGPSGKVLAMDIQEEACRDTREKTKELSQVRVVQDSFVHLAIQWKVWLGTTRLSEEQRPGAVVFNLGYLPGGDKEIVTSREVTVPALTAAADLIRTGGLITVVLYDGHPEGEEEKKAVLAFGAGLDGREYHTGYFSFPNQEKAPEVMWITRKGREL